MKLILVIILITSISIFAGNFKIGAASGIATYSLKDDWKALETPLMGGITYKGLSKDIPIHFLAAPVIENKDGENQSRIDIVLGTDLIGKIGIGYFTKFWDAQEPGGLVPFTDNRLGLLWRLR